MNYSWRHLIVGSSGCGKTQQALKIAIKYYDLLLHNKIYLINFDQHDKRLSIITRMLGERCEIISTFKDIEYYRDSLLVFDNMETVSEGDLDDFAKSLFLMGRHFNICVVYCFNSPFKLNNMFFHTSDRITLFPRAASNSVMIPLIQKFFGLDKDSEKIQEFLTLVKNRRKAAVTLTRI